MSLLSEEIDSQPSPLGEVSLRKRCIPVPGDRDIDKVELGEDSLISRMLFEAE